MNIKYYKNITANFFAAMNNVNFEEVTNDMCDDISFDFPGTKLLEGKRRVLLFLNALLRKYQSLNFNVSEIIVDKNSAVAIWTNKGQTVDGLDYSNSGVTHIRFRDDKIEFLSDYFKDTSFTQV